MSVTGPADMALTGSFTAGWLLHRSRRPIAAIGVWALMTFSRAAILVVVM